MKLDTAAFDFYRTPADLCPAFTRSGVGSCLACSDGPTEGAVNRLKTIKRQRYGRANFDLPRIRVLSE